MSPTLRFDLVVPLYNEERNVRKLIADIVDSNLPSLGLANAVLVNNGCKDGTAAILRELSERHLWIRVVTLPANVLYGGGVQEGLRATTSEYVGIIPGDNQVAPSDLLKVWNELQNIVGLSGERHVLVKGWRTHREDGFGIRLASFVYSRLANVVLGLGLRDINGQPKLFHRSLLDLLPEETLRTFTFDAQLLDNAHQAGWKMAEVPVRFLARREGVSSWSSNRLRTYRETALQLLKLRHMRALPPKRAQAREPEEVLDKAA
jgi:glycosyltransferase involved in cell wall biosynthesis